MSRIRKFTVSTALFLPLVLGGCDPKKGITSPEDYFPLIQVVLGSGGTAAMIGRDEAIRAKNFEGCVAAGALVSAFDSANQVLAGQLADQIIIPALEIDVSDCLALRENAAETADSAATGEKTSYAPYLLETRVSGYVAPTETSTEAAASTTEAPAAATDEAPLEAPVAAPVEEKVMTEAKGNPDVAALVDAIAGITLVAVLHYANKVKGANCKKGMAAIGVVTYINSMLKPVTDEIAAPDGIISVPVTTLDLSECKES